LSVTTPAKSKLAVEVEVEPLDGGQVKLSVRVPADQVSRVKDQLVEAFARRTSIPGFRRGKAPRAIVERYIDQEALKEQIVDALLSDAYDEALEKAQIKPLDRARIEDPSLTDDGALAFTATVTRQPEITLGQYKGLSATRRISRVTDEQVDRTIENSRARQAEYVELPEDAAVEKGDLVIVDYDMFVDGQRREDGSASGYPLEVGADQLFPQLNDILPGARIGEAREFDVSYPPDHSDPSLAGKTAHFTVTVKQARRRQLPPLDDDYARRFTGVENLEGLRARVRANLEALARDIAEGDLRDELLRQVTESASLDVPQAIVGREVDRRIDQIQEELERRHLTLHQHLREIGRSFEDWRADLEADARLATRQALVLEEIGEREGVTVTDEDLRQELQHEAQLRGVDERTLEKQLAESGQLSRLATRIYHRKVIDLLVQNANITEEIVEPDQAQDAPEPG